MIIFQIILCFFPLILGLIILPLTIKSLTFKNIFLGIALGLFSFIPIVIIQMFLYKIPIFNKQTIGALFISCLIGNGFIEEFFKMILLNFIPIKSQNITKKCFFSIALISTLTLASFESLIYFFNGFTNILLRFVSAVFIHCICCILSSIFLWQKKQTKKFNLFFLWAVLLHGLFNFFIVLPGKFWIISIIVEVFGIIKITLALIPEKDLS